MRNTEPFEIGDSFDFEAWDRRAEALRQEDAHAKEMHWHEVVLPTIRRAFADGDAAREIVWAAMDRTAWLALKDKEA
jgi:hypothetical protein